MPLHSQKNWVLGYKLQGHRAPGWLRRLSIRPWLRSWSCGSWVQALRRVLCCQLRAHFGLSVLPTPFCPSPTGSLSLSPKINKSFKKNYRVTPTIPLVTELFGRWDLALDSCRYCWSLRQPFYFLGLDCPFFQHFIVYKKGVDNQTSSSSSMKTSLNSETSEELMVHTTLFTSYFVGLFVLIYF